MEERLVISRGITPRMSYVHIDGNDAWLIDCDCSDGLLQWLADEGEGKAARLDRFLFWFQII